MLPTTTTHVVRHVDYVVMRSRKKVKVYGLECTLCGWVKHARNWPLWTTSGLADGAAGAHECER